MYETGSDNQLFFSLLQKTIINSYFSTTFDEEKQQRFESNHLQNLNILRSKSRKKNLYQDGKAETNQKTRSEKRKEDYYYLVWVR